MKPLGGDKILDHAHDMLLLAARQPGNFLENPPGLADRAVATLRRLVMSEQVIDGNVEDGSQPREMFRAQGRGAALQSA